MIDLDGCAKIREFEYRQNVKKFENCLVHSHAKTSSNAGDSQQTYELEISKQELTADVQIEDLRALVICLHSKTCRSGFESIPEMSVTV